MRQSRLADFVTTESDKIDDDNNESLDSNHSTNSDKEQSIMEKTEKANPRRRGGAEKG